MTVLTIVAFVVYFIWPFPPGLKSITDIYELAETKPFSTLMSLDLFYVIINFITVPFFIGIFFAIKDVNFGFAFVAFIYGMFSCLLGIISRPISEMFYLSDMYHAASTEMERLKYLAAGEAICVNFYGTSWMLYYITYGIEAFVSSILMLRSGHFTKPTALIGIFMVIGVFSIIPGFAATVYGKWLNLITTAAGVIWIALTAISLLRLADLEERIVGKA